MMCFPCPYFRINSPAVLRCLSQAAREYEVMEANSDGDILAADRGCDPSSQPRVGLRYLALQDHLASKYRLHRK